jgi:hypothetical protein
VAPRIGAFVVAGWLFGIVINLLTKNAPQYYDIALRDFGLMLAALTFARLALVIVPLRKSGALPKRPWYRCAGGAAKRWRLPTAAGRDALKTCLERVRGCRGSDSNGREWRGATRTVWLHSAPASGGEREADVSARKPACFRLGPVTHRAGDGVELGEQAA